MAATETPKIPTYGNWRSPQRGGLGRLSMGGTVLLLGGLMLVVAMTLVSFVLALVVALLLALLLIPLTIRDQHGRTMMARLHGRLSWRRTVKTGSHLYLSGPLGRTGHGTCTLPGLAASSTMSEAQDSYGRPYALLSYPTTNHHVVVFDCQADGASLVDQEQVDQWVAHWGSWLSRLAHEPGLVGASVTVETAPDSGIRLSQEVTGNLHPEAPEAARRMLTDVLAQYPAGSAQITTRVALTYSGAAEGGRERKDADAMAVLLGNRLPHLTDSLAMTGAGSARPLTAAELAEAVRIAYDPAVAPLVEQARAQGGSGLEWTDAGPSGAEEAWDHYRHDTGVSVTWQMSEAPRGEVLSSVLYDLLAPNPDIARKRVTLYYRPHNPAQAAKIVEQDKLDATFRSNQSKTAAARASVALKAAEQSAQEEAKGAGVTRFALAVTATVTDYKDLPLALTAVDNLAPQSRIRLRLVTRAQAAAFAAALPIGLVLPAHLLIPTVVRDNL
ncbi:SCO6880 family protein [Streptomyces canus]|uniref:SCO6880 family protein n=1 Tax=Streptomyces canus TaxID=58343 RepID=UPI002E2567F4